METRPKSLVSPVHEVGLCLTIYAAQFLSQAAIGNTIIALHIIASDLSVSTTDGLSQLPWFVAAYSLTFGSFILITGRLGDVYGHKRLFVAGFVWWGVCSLLLGFSPYTSSVAYFDVFRAAQGIGPATAVPNGVALLARVYPNGPRKTAVFAGFGVSSTLGFLGGATFGAIFGQLAWWPWTFWSMAISCSAIALLAAFVVVPSEVAPPVNPDGAVDWLGAVVAVAGIISFIYAWNEAPAVGWSEPYVFALLIVGVLLLVLFCVVESWVKAPIMPLDIWSHPGSLG
jgi:MFS family permease